MLSESRSRAEFEGNLAWVTGGEYNNQISVCYKVENLTKKNFLDDKEENKKRVKSIFEFYNVPCFPDTNQTSATSYKS